MNCHETGGTNCNYVKLVFISTGKTVFLQRPGGIIAGSRWYLVVLKIICPVDTRLCTLYLSGIIFVVCSGSGQAKDRCWFTCSKNNNVADYVSRPAQL